MIYKKLFLPPGYPASNPDGAYLCSATAYESARDGLSAGLLVGPNATANDNYRKNAASVLADSGVYQVIRSVVFFDTSEIPNNATVLEAYLILNGYSDKVSALGEPVPGYPTKVMIQQTCMRTPIQGADFWMSLYHLGVRYPSALYSSGDYIYIGGGVSDNVVKFDGLNFYRVGEALPGGENVSSIVKFSDDNHILAAFEDTDEILQFDGTTWGATAATVGPGQAPVSLIEWDGDIYCAFLTSGGVQYWNGVAWAQISVAASCRDLWEWSIDGNLYLAAGNTVTYWDGVGWNATAALGDTVPSHFAEYQGKLLCSCLGSVRSWSGFAWSDTSFGDFPASPGDILVYNNLLYCVDESDSSIKIFDGGTWTDMGLPFQGDPGTAKLSLVGFNNELYVSAADATTEVGSLWVYRNSRWNNVSAPKPIAEVVPWDNNGINVFALNSLGKKYIDKTGTSRFLIREYEFDVLNVDPLADPPGAVDWVYYRNGMYYSDNGIFYTDPQLVVVYDDDDEAEPSEYGDFWPTQFELVDERTNVTVLSLPLQASVVTGIGLPPISSFYTQSPLSYKADYVAATTRPRPFDVTLNLKEMCRSGQSVWELRQEIIRRVSYITGTLIFRIRTRGGKVFELRDVVLDSGFDLGVDANAHARYQQIALRFMALDPIWWGDYHEDSYNIAPDSVQFDFSTSGTFYTFPEIEIFGALTQPWTLEFWPTGGKIGFSTDLAEGEGVYIKTLPGERGIKDTAGLFMEVDGDTTLSLCHFVPSPAALAGVNSIRVNSTDDTPTPEAVMCVMWYDRWLGL